MPRLPVPGLDNDNWGVLLNEYLLYEHKADGSHNDGLFNVLTYGARGDGVTDDTAAIQAALDAAAPAGGVVWLTPGPNAYRCNGSLTIPINVTLKGATAECGVACGYMGIAPAVPSCTSIRRLISSA